MGCTTVGLHQPTRRSAISSGFVKSAAGTVAVMTQQERTWNARSRWAAIGAAVAVTLGGGGIGLVHATVSSGPRAIYQAINPCRLADTRPAPVNVGLRNTPIGANETLNLDGWGTHGDCSLPDDTAALELNVTALNATSPTFIQVFPADETRPEKGSNLNLLPGQPPAPNSVTATLADDGTFSIYNLAGTVDVIVDVVGYYEDHDHDDRYYTEQEVDELLDDAIGTRAPVLPAPVQDITAVDPGYVDSGGSTYLNVSIDTTDPIVVNRIDLTLPDECPGTDEYDVIVTAAGHAHYAGSDEIDGELELEVNDVNDFRANLEIQLEPSDNLNPEVPYSRTILLTLDAGTHKIEWTAEKEYSASDTFNVRNPIMVAQPAAHRCP